MKNDNCSRKAKNYVGQKFSRLTVLSESDKHFSKNGIGRRMALCVCDCGEEKALTIK